MYPCSQVGWLRGTRDPFPPFLGMRAAHPIALDFFWRWDMVLLIDRDILHSFCVALDVEWEVVNVGSSIFFSRSGELDFVHCSWDPSQHGEVRLEMGEIARGGYLVLTEAALVKRHEQLDRVKGKKREVMIDEIAALVAMRRLLRRN